jgi:hypothetical protein
MVILDLVLPGTLLVVLFGSFRTLSVALTVAIVSPILLIPTMFAFFLMLLIFRTGVCAMLESQREDAICRTPIHNTFAMLVDGLVTLRAFEKI